MKTIFSLWLALLVGFVLLFNPPQGKAWLVQTSAAPPSNFAQDNFPQTAGTLITADFFSNTWTQSSNCIDASGSNSAVINGSCFNTLISAIDSGTPPSANYHVLGGAQYDSPSFFNGVAARITSGTTYYFCGWNTFSTNEFDLSKDVSGTFTTLSSHVTSVTSGTANFDLQVNGTAISCTVSGADSASLSATDSAITSTGNSGIVMDTGSSTKGLVSFSAHP